MADLDLDAILEAHGDCLSRNRFAADRANIVPLVQEVERLRAEVERVRALHTPTPGVPLADRCVTCSRWSDTGRLIRVPYPCPTLRALDGVQRRLWAERAKAEIAKKPKCRDRAAEAARAVENTPTEGERL